MRTLTLDGGGRLAYAEYGDSDGIPVVFLHSMPGSRLLEVLFDAPTEERGARVLAPDGPGHGRSLPCPILEESGNPNQRPTEPTPADFFDALLDDAGAQLAGVVALSSENHDALVVALTRLDRTRHVSVVAGAIPPGTCEGTPGMQRLLSWLVTNVPALLGCLFRERAWLTDRLDPLITIARYAADDMDEAVPEGVAVLVRGDFVAGISHSRQDVVDDFRTAAAQWGIPFDDIETNVSLWHGDTDTNVPMAGARRPESEISGTRLRAVCGANHLRTLLRSVPSALDGQCRTARSLDLDASDASPGSTAAAESHHRI